MSYRSVYAVIAFVCAGVGFACAPGALAQTSTPEETCDGPIELPPVDVSASRDRQIRERANYIADAMEDNLYGMREEFFDVYEDATGVRPTNAHWAEAVNALRNVIVSATSPDGSLEGQTNYGGSGDIVIEIFADRWNPFSAEEQGGLMIHEFLHAVSYAATGYALDTDLDHEIFARLFRGIWERGTCPPAGGASHGDPHIVTLDGLLYSFQTVGEFVLIRSKGGLLDVQTRQERVPGRQVSLNTAVAFRAGDHRVAIYARDFPGVDISQTPILVDGAPLVVPDDGAQIGPVRLTRQGEGRFEAAFPGGRKVAVNLSSSGEFRFMNVRLYIPATLSGMFSGLLGDRDGRAENDLTARGGEVISPESSYGDLAAALDRRIRAPIPLSALETTYQETLHRRFGDSWRVSAEESLFDYFEGESVETYADPAFPASFLTLSSFARRDVRAAERTCREAGVAPDFFDGCVFDVAATGDGAFAEAAAQILRDEIETRLRDEVENRLRRRLPIPDRN